MKRLWIAVLLLLVVFIATVCNSRYLMHFSGGLTDLLSQAESSAEAGDWAEASQCTENALQIWQGHGLYLHAVLRHSDIDLAYASFREVREFIDCHEGGEYSAANAKLIAQIELIYEMEQLNLKNLL